MKTFLAIVYVQLVRRIIRMRHFLTHLPKQTAEHYSQAVNYLQLTSFLNAPSRVPLHSGNRWEISYTSQHIFWLFSQTKAKMTSWKWCKNITTQICLQQKAEPYKTQTNVTNIFQVVLTRAKWALWASWVELDPVQFHLCGSNGWRDVVLGWYRVWLDLLAPHILSKLHPESGFHAPLIFFNEMALGLESRAMSNFDYVTALPAHKQTCCITHLC